MEKIPKTVDQDVYVYWWPLLQEFVVYSTELRCENWVDHIFVGKTRVQLDVPENIDITGQQIANLERQRDEIRSEYGEKIDGIDRQIRELQALEHTSGETA